MSIPVQEDLKARRMRAELLTAKARQLFDAGHKEVIVIDEDDTRTKHRLFISGSETLGYYAKGARRYGYPFMQLAYDSKDVEPVVKNLVTPAEKWEKDCRKVIQLLTESGLWPEIKDEFEMALRVGYDKLLQCKEADNCYDSNITWDEQQARKTAKIKEILPELIHIGDDGKEHYEVDFLWHWAPPHQIKIKAMNFGKYQNEYVLARIKAALEHKVESRESARASYDVSFSYNPELSKAWYSEEYKGCGNGHYYLALDATHALFYEDD